MEDLERDPSAEERAIRIIYFFAEIQRDFSLERHSVIMAHDNRDDKSVPCILVLFKVQDFPILNTNTYSLRRRIEEGILFSMPDEIPFSSELEFNHLEIKRNPKDDGFYLNLEAHVAFF